MILPLTKSVLCGSEVLRALDKPQPHFQPVLVGEELGLGALNVDRLVEVAPQSVLVTVQDELVL